MSQTSYTGNTKYSEMEKQENSILRHKLTNSLKPYLTRIYIPPGNTAAPLSGIHSNPCLTSPVLEQCLHISSEIPV